jgi:hypothetical protein
VRVRKSVDAASTAACLVLRHSESTAAAGAGAVGGSSSGAETKSGEEETVEAGDGAGRVCSLGNTEKQL